MMISYIETTTDGKIVGSGIVQEECKDYITLSPNNTLIFGIHADPSSYTYFDGINIVNMPEKPIGEYKFNYEYKQWEYDITTATTNALVKRDKLLSEGPDRISPVWWSSMTAQQQQDWTDYRQALLDVTGQADYPQVIIWPTKPE